jgi:hypothetical protein
VSPHALNVVFAFVLLFFPLLDVHAVPSLPWHCWMTSVAEHAHGAASLLKAQYMYDGRPGSASLCLTAACLVHIAAVFVLCTTAGHQLPGASTHPSCNLLQQAAS